MYKVSKLLPATASQIPEMAESIQADFAADGYDVKIEMLSNSGCDISLSKGGFFKTIAGLRTALKINMVPQVKGVKFNAGIGIFGQQVVPLAIVAMVGFWPILITQIWGATKQSKLDDRALADAERVLMGVHNLGTASPAGQAYGYASTPNASGSKFCTNCGQRIDAQAKFCPNCGQQV